MTAKDAYGNTNPSGVTTVAFTSSAVGGTGTYGSVTNAGGGIYTSPFTGVTIGSVTLGATINSSTVTSTPSPATIMVTPLAAHGGWNDVVALGRKSDYSDAELAARSTTFGWNAFTPTGGTIATYNVYRATTSAGQDFGTPLATGIDPAIRTYTDSATTAGTTYYYVVRPVIGGQIVGTPENFTEIRILAPPDNMVLVHHWIANQDMCATLGKTIGGAEGSAIHPDQNYKCDYTGAFGSTQGHYDIGYSFLVDMQEQGCNYTRTNVYNGAPAITMAWADNTKGSDGNVHYHRSNGTGDCSYKKGGVWYGADSTNLTAGELATMSSNRALLPPLAQINQMRAADTCQAQTVNIDGASTPKRLLRRKEQLVATAWSPLLADATIDAYEAGTVTLSSNHYCNTKEPNGLTYEDLDQPTPPNIETEPHGLTDGKLTVRTGGPLTTLCKTRYGAQDMVGNVDEWLSDQLGTCNATSNVCVGRTSTVDPGNTDWNGLGFDGVHASGGTNSGTWASVDYFTLGVTNSKHDRVLLPYGLPWVSSSSAYETALIGTGITNTTTHNDLITIKTDNPIGTTAARAAITGGALFWPTSSYNGRWAFSLADTPEETAGAIGFRCMIPVTPQETAPSAVTSLAWNVAPVTNYTASDTTPMTTFKAEIRDGGGSVITSDNVTKVTLTLLSGTGVLVGPITQTVVAGVATFSDVTYTKAENIVIRATENTSNRTVDSGTITVAPGPFSLWRSQFTSAANVASGSSILVTLTAVDAYGNANPSGITTVTFTSSVVGGTGSFGSVTNQGNGVYTSVFTGDNGGSVTIGGTINGGTVTSTPSPATVTVTLAANHGGWANVVALGRKSDLDDTEKAARSVTLTWNAFTPHGATIDSYNIYRATTSGGQDFGTPLASGITTGTRSYEDITASAGTSYFYVVRPVMNTQVIATPENYSEIKVLAPPDNMVLVHRWIANQEMCGLLGKTIGGAEGSAIHPTENYRCDYTGTFGSTNGHYDIGYSFLVDMQEQGCRYNTDNVYNNGPAIGVTAPLDAFGSIGNVYYDRNSHKCYIKNASDVWIWAESSSLSSAQRAALSSNKAHLPPLTQLNQNRSWDTCQAQNVTLDGVSTDKRLLRRKEQVVAAAWPSGMVDATIATYEAGSTDLTNLNYCNSNSAGNGLTYDNNAIPANIETLPSDLLSAVTTVRTGGTLTSLCKTRYGAQDMVGNVIEWVSDQLESCDATSNICRGGTSALDLGNFDINGFAFDGIEGPGGEATASVDSDAFAGSLYSQTRMILPLGLPLVSSSSSYASALIGTNISSTALHGDDFGVFTDVANGSGMARGGRTGGSVYFDGSSGRWHLDFMHIPMDGSRTIGFRCMAPLPNSTPSITAPTITSPTEAAAVNTLVQTYTGTCDSTAGLTTTVTGGTGVTVTESSCVGGVLTVTVIFEAGATSRVIVITTSDSYGNQSSITRSVSNSFSCPTNYVGVPRNTSLGTSDFCVARYEMKAVNGSNALVNGGNGAFTYDVTNCPTAGDCVPASRPDGTPWVNISYSNSIAECGALGNGYSLISNAQWQTLARNIESVPGNWTGGSVGSGGVPRGHSDDLMDANAVTDGLAFAGSSALGAYPISVGNALPSTVDFTKYRGNTAAYRGTGNNVGQDFEFGKEQARFHVLTTGEAVWDVAGNVWEWTSDLLDGYDTSPPLGANNWTSYSDTVELGAPGTTNRTMFAPLNPAYDLTHGMGEMNGGTGGVIRRGGYWGFDNGAGIFSANLNSSTSNTGNNYGFRCVYAPATTTNPALHVSIPPNGGAVKTIFTEYGGHCDSTAGFTTTVTGGSGVTISGTSCTNGVLKFKTQFAYGTAPGTQSVTITTRNASSVVVETLSHSVTNNFYCPTNYIGVPGHTSADIPTTDFCVARYEMKAVDSGNALVNGGNGVFTYDLTNCPTAGDCVPASRPDGTPWVDISQTDALSECSTLGTGFSLISNPQWQTVARNVEAVASNWSGGSVGSGRIPRGNSDNALSGTAITPDGLAFGGTLTLMAYTSNASYSTVDADPYRGTGNNSGQAYGSGKEQWRMLTLSTGEAVWDMASNAWEWVSDLINGSATSPALSTNAWYEYTNATFFDPATMDANRVLFAPSNSTYNSAHGMGQLYGGSGGATTRGGSWDAGNLYGIFAADLNNSASSAVSSIGFRCTFAP